MKDRKKERMMDRRKKGKKKERMKDKKMDRQFSNKGRKERKKENISRSVQTNAMKYFIKVTKTIFLMAIYTFQEHIKIMFQKCFQ
jgi:hypothetical protein